MNREPTRSARERSSAASDVYNRQADEIGGKVLVLSPLEIVSDETYVEKMTQNLNNLKDALC